MESAIDRHLQCPRTRTRRIADDYQAPFPAFAARAPIAMTKVVMGYFGIQCRDAKDPRAIEAFVALKKLFSGPHGPKHTDFATYIDGAGYHTILAIAYWTAPAEYELWTASPPVADWWNSDQRLSNGVGYFREILKPKAEQFETAYGAPGPLEGVGVVMGSLSGEIQEHGYWGSMRDRVPLSQTDTMTAEGKIATAHGEPASGRRVAITGHKNVAIIRSGQDWTDTTGEERRVYLEDIEPTLRAGMKFLRDQGMSIGCYTNRYVQVTDAEGKTIDKSFGVSLWHSLADLERWAETHPTHLSIFTTFLGLVTKLPNLRLYHEVSVMDADAQVYEYINCHPDTGLLRAATISS